ncbi:MAG: hypothetical protein E5W06_00240 [Mesorhizobium sp.]|nr:MAG: hypothetical protein E5W06_00240 [Mesorhizobium sp.]
MSAAWSIAYGREKEHAAELRAGLRQMQAGFLAELCGLCSGEGQYEQMYTAGCGGGYFRSMGGCDYCNGTGLRQGAGPAPISVVEQVTNAGRAAITGDAV